MHPVPVLLVKLDSAGQFDSFGIVKRSYVGLDAHVSEQCDTGPKCHTEAPAGDVALERPNVCAHHFGRKKARETALNGETIQRIV